MNWYFYLADNQRYWFDTLENALKAKRDGMVGCSQIGYAVDGYVQR